MQSYTCLCDKCSCGNDFNYKCEVNTSNSYYKYFCKNNKCICKNHNCICNCCSRDRVKTSNKSSKDYNDELAIDQKLYESTLFRNYINMI